MPSGPELYRVTLVSFTLTSIMGGYMNLAGIFQVSMIKYCSLSLSRRFNVVCFVLYR